MQINDRDHLKFFLHSGQLAEFPEGGGFPVLRDLWHCLQSWHPQFLQLIDDEEPHPDENLHISNDYSILLLLLSIKSDVRLMTTHLLELISHQWKHHKWLVFPLLPLNCFHLSKKQLNKSLIPSTGGITFRLKPLILTASRTFKSLFLWSLFICLNIF